MALIERWLWTDPATGETWTMPRNPRMMGSLYGPRQIDSRTTTAVDGQAIVFEGNRKPVEWDFEGAILSHAHYEALRHWVYDKPNRITLRDHYGRNISLVLTDYQPIPKRRLNKYWSHDYSIRAIVFSVGAPTVGV